MSVGAAFTFVALDVLDDVAHRLGKTEVIQSGTEFLVLPALPLDYSG